MKNTSDTPQRKETRSERRRRQMSEFVAHLLTSRTAAEAAQKVRISTRQATRWMRTEEYRDAYVASRRASLATLGDLLRSLGIASAEQLGEVLRDPEAAATPKVAAAKTVLSSLLAIEQVAALEARITKLEAETQSER